MRAGCSSARSVSVGDATARASVVVVCLLVTQRLSVSVGEKKKMHKGKTTLEFQIARSQNRGTRQEGKSTEKVHKIISENRGNFHFFFATQSRYNSDEGFVVEISCNKENLLLLLVRENTLSKTNVLLRKPLDN